LVAAGAVRVGDGQARAHEGLGHAHRALGDRAQARRHFERALAIYTDLGMPQADTVRAQLAGLSQPQPVSVVARA
jgi:hypothetical protein